jgi:hypothetical protein
MLFLVHDKDSNDVKFHGIQAFYLKENTMASSKDIIDNPIANYDSDRKGIFIHKHQLNDSGFKVGDRFSVKVGKQDLLIYLPFRLSKTVKAISSMIKTGSLSNEPAGSTSYWAAYLMNMFFTSSPMCRNP